MDLAEQRRVARSAAISFGRRHAVALVILVITALIGAKVFEDCEKNAGEPENTYRGGGAPRWTRRRRMASRR